ncbi:MAG: hypothetical protein ABSC77_02710 [Terracidiphilus sp.]|jgi:hypothetical protein
MKHSRILIFLLLLGGILFPAAARALDTPTKAEAIADMYKIENILLKYDIIPPEVAKDYDNTVGIISCIDTAKDEVTVMVCIDNFKDTYIGEVLLAAVPSWFWDLLNVYIDIRTLNIPDMFLNWTEAAVCALVETLASGVDICGIIGEFIDVGEDLSEITKAVLKFAEEIGADAWHSVKCTVKPSSCEDKMTGLQIAWRDFFQNILTSNQGFAWRTTPPYSLTCLNQMAWGPNLSLTAAPCAQDTFCFQLQTQVIAAANVIHTNGSYSSTHDSDIAQAATMLADGVNKQWDASILDPNNGSMKSITVARKNFIDTQQDAAVRQVVTTPDEAAVKTPAALESYMTNWCVANFRAQAQKTVLATVPGLPGQPAIQVTLMPKVENVDFWLTAPTSVSMSQKAAFESTANWCHNDFYLDRRATSLVNLFAHHLVSDLGCSPAGTIAPAAGAIITGDLWCPTTEAYNRCTEVMASLNLGTPPVQCKIKPLCPTFGGVYYCSDGVAYQSCLVWARQSGYNDSTKHCGFDTSGEGPLLAKEIRYWLVKGQLENGTLGPPSKFAAYCSVNGRPEEVKASSGAVQPGKMQNMAGVVTGSAQGTRTAPVALPNMPRTSPSVLDCPRPTLKHLCEVAVQKYQAEAKLPVALVTCTDDHVDPAYQKMADQVQNYARGVAGLHTGPDPLLLTGYAPICPQEFVCVTSVTPSVDGVNVPTILLQGSAPTQHVIPVAGATHR